MFSAMQRRMCALIQTSAGSRPSVTEVSRALDLFLGLQEAQVRPVLGGAVEVPGVAREEHRRAGVVACERALVGVQEALQLQGIVGLDPARGQQRGRSEEHKSELQSLM